MIHFYRSCLALALILCSAIGSAKSLDISDNIKEEARWKKWSLAIANHNLALQLEESESIRKSCVTKTCTTDFDVFLYSLSEASGDKFISKDQLEKWMTWAEAQPLAVDELAQLAWTFKGEFPVKWAAAQVRLKQAASEQKLLGRTLSPRFEQMLNYANENFVPVPIDPNRAQIAHDLVTQNPPIDKYGDGEYRKGLRLYMFCRDDRHYACLMVMRNSQGALVKKGNSYWTHKSLGFSRLEKKFDQVNGNTPAGVFLIDGVMPHTDQQQLFGKFRRLILNFPERSADEEQYKTLLPASSHKASWWKESVIARNMGRGLFRIHGTLRQSPKGAPYFPFFGTGGCVAQRENTYNRVTYMDQRHLLDDLMKNLDLDAIYANEVHIKGLLYVINLDSAKKAVELNDLIKAKILN